MKWRKTKSGTSQTKQENENEALFAKVVEVSKQSYFKKQDQQNEEMEVYEVMGNRREVLNYLLGAGDHKTAKVWFVGIEEAQKWDEKYLTEIEGYENKDFNTVEAGKILEEEEKIKKKGERFTNIYDIISKIVMGLQGDDWENKWKEYRNEKLFREKSEALQINLYPLGKKHVGDWPQEYKQWFGFTTKEEYYKWLSENKSDRFAQIREKRKEDDNPLTICFGKSVWSDFRGCFCLKENNEDMLSFYTKEKIILTPFFWYGGKYGMSHKRIGEFLDLIKKANLDPFTGENRDSALFQTTRND